MRTHVDEAVISPNVSLPGSDLFGRLRVSQPFTLLDTVHEYDMSPFYWDSILVGGGNVTFVPNQSAVQLNVTAANGDSAKFQTKNYLRYQPGKSQFAIFTGVLGPKTPNVVRRGGYFDDRNGLFFEVTGRDIAVVRRSSTSGTPVDNRIPQTSWNLDRLDGTGASGMVLDTTLMNFFFVDFTWLSIGVVRWGVEANGVQTLCHMEFHANLLSVPYMTTGSLPIRYEITNTGPTTGPNSLLAVCATVISEGGQEPLGTPFGISTGTAAKVVTAQHVPILSIRVALTLNGIPNRMLATITDAACLADAALIFEVWGNSTLTGASFVNVDPNSGMQFDTAATAMSGGVLHYAGFVPVVGSGANRNGSGKLGDVTDIGLNKLKMSLNAAGTVGDMVTLAASKITANATEVSGTFNWLEHR